LEIVDCWNINRVMRGLIALIMEEKAHLALCVRNFCFRRYTADTVLLYTVVA